MNQGEYEGFEIGVEDMRGVRSLVDPAACEWGVLQTVHVDIGGVSESTQPKATGKTEDGTRSGVRSRRSLLAVVHQATPNPTQSSSRGCRMMQQSRLSVMSGRTPLRGVLSTLQASEEVREATTGRVVTLPQVWAVAAPRLVREVSAEKVPGAKKELTNQNAKGRTVPLKELAFYRKYTERLLERYVQMSMEAGRVSSMMGHEVIGGKASSYRIHGFDDAVIFRLDVEKCLEHLSSREREVVRRVAMQEYTQTEAAELMGVSLRTVVNRYGRALDRLTEILLRTRLLDPIRACQAASRARAR